MLVTKGFNTTKQTYELTDVDATEGQSLGDGD